MCSYTTICRLLFTTLICLGIFLFWCLWMPTLLDIGGEKFHSKVLDNQAVNTLNFIQNHRVVRGGCRCIGGGLLLVSLGLLFTTNKRKWLKSSFACAVGLNCMLMPSLLKQVTLSNSQKITTINHQNLYQICQRLQLVECHNPFDEPISQQTAKIETFDEFAQWTRSQYQEHYSNIQSVWPFHHEDEYKAAFITNLVSNLWGYGNINAVNKPGCVLGNEDQQWQRPDLKSINAATYLRSKIGCCNDHAYLVKFLLDSENIPNRLTVIPGHIFNEANIDGQWWTLDATANLMIPHAWETIHQTMKPTGRDWMQIYLFAHSNLRDIDSERYRSAIGHFRLHQLLSIAIQRDRGRSITHPDFPNYFRAAIERECGCPTRSE